MENNIEELEIFLGGTFHQDIKEPEDALLNYISSVGSDWLEKLSTMIEEFLDSKLSDDEKAEFITKNTDIYFPAIGMSPVEWLYAVLSTIRTKYNSNSS